MAIAELKQHQEHRFGGPWTDKKLEALQKYLSAYRDIFQKNERARFFRTTYLDAFAGTGRRTNTASPDRATLRLFDDADAQSYKAGSATIALETSSPFDNYIFVDNNRLRVRELNDLKRKYPLISNRIEVYQDDANRFVRQWCQELAPRDRAVVFLDPYGMNVEWETVQSIARTKAVDLWYLFPFGQGVIRHLTDAPPAGPDAERLTRLFGTDEWRTAFYAPTGQMNFLDGPESPVRVANLESVGRFLISRLNTAFPKVLDTPLQLCNSKQVPIYLLCFAAANPKKADLAVKIARSIVG